MIIDRYIMREIIKPTVAVSSILIFIFGCYMATRFLADALVGQLPGTTVILLILLRIAIALEVLLPTTLYLSVVVALGRLYKDSEMTALFACGVSMGRVLRPVLYTALIIAVIVASLSLFIRPWAYDRYYRLKAHAEANFDLTRMHDGTFYETENGGRVIYAEKVDHQQDQAQRVFIRTEREDTLQVIYARQANQSSDGVSGKQILVFTDGYLYEFSRTGEEGRVIQFEKSAMPLEPKENLRLKYRVKSASTGSLARSDDSEEIAEFQWRLSTPLATILLALLGVPLSRSSPRRGKYAKVTTAVVIFAVYYNLSALTKKWVEKGVLDSIPGIWWIQFLLVGLLLFLFWQPPLIFFRRGR
ncbi:MAG: LPS export ABC transporter permease LptF [Deltaproteobacteria bacterium]|jgi:lipopolysaccharide export system permease protein|nr:LPS export ABC transporter permease LptF [Deltaproteobacteria bacterium]